MNYKDESEAEAPAADMQTFLLKIDKAEYADEKHKGRQWFAFSGTNNR
jgi:hypothetical protein